MSSGASVDVLMCETVNVLSVRMRDGVMCRSPVSVCVCVTVYLFMHVLPPFFFPFIDRIQEDGPKPAGESCRLVPCGFRSEEDARVGGAEVAFTVSSH